MCWICCWTIKKINNSISSAEIISVSRIRAVSYTHLDVYKRQPLCKQCPWNSLCLARKEERIAELPVKTKAKARRIEKRTVLVIRDNDKVAIRKRPEKGLLAGLYELPNVEGRYSQNEIVQLVKDMHL